MIDIRAIFSFSFMLVHEKNLSQALPEPVKLTHRYCFSQLQYRPLPCQAPSSPTCFESRDGTRREAISGPFHLSSFTKASNDDPEPMLMRVASN